MMSEIGFEDEFEDDVSHWYVSDWIYHDSGMI